MHQSVINQNEKIRRWAIRSYSNFCTFLSWSTRDNPKAMPLEWYHRFIASQIDDGINRSEHNEQPFKSFEMPPRHGKTQLCGRWLLAYYFGRFPNKKCMYVTMVEDSALDIKKDTIDVIQTAEFKWLFPKSIIKKSTGNKITNMDSHDGFLLFLGRDSSITGKGIDLTIVDDPYKGLEDAASPKKSEKVWRDVFLGIVSTRSEPGSFKLISYTRWDEHDIIGRYQKLCEDSKDDNLVKIESFKFPAEKTEEINDYDKRELHEPLDKRFLHQYALAKTDPFIWSSVYQQKPINKLTQLFRLDWMERFYRQPLLDRILIVIDSAYKEKSKGIDRCGIMVFGTHNRRYYPIEIIYKKMDYPELLAVTQMLARKYDYWAIVIEEKANGDALIASMRLKFPRVVGVNPQGKSKKERAQMILPIVESGALLLPDASICYNVHELVSQLISFRGEGNEADDLVDCVIYALSYYEKWTPYANVQGPKLGTDKIATKYLPKPTFRIGVAKRR